MAEEERDSRLWLHELSASNRALEYKALYEIEGNDVRISVRRDAIDHQSHGTVEVFNSKSRQWFPVYALQTMNLGCLKFSYLPKDLQEFFKVDEERLLKIASRILKPKRRETQASSKIPLFLRLKAQIEVLIGESEGVTCLHKNGDVATWEWLLDHGWLSALAELDAKKGDGE